MIVQFFKNLFITSGQGDYKPVLRLVERKVNNKMNEELTMPFEAAEVKEALDQMAPNKVPSPDGMSAMFPTLLAYSWELCYKSCAGFSSLRRNKMQMESTLVQCKQAADHAISMYKAYNEVQLASSRNIRVIYQWQKPPDGFVKINVDGAIFEDIKKAGVGVILRDAIGRVVMAATKREDDVDEVATIEALAILRGQQLCMPLGICKLVIESDSLLLVQELQASSDSLANAGNIIAEVRQLLSRFQEVQIQHVNRLGNSVAHALARNA